MAVLAYHQETGAEIMVEPDAMTHLRASGWLLRSEHEANLAEAAAAEAAAAEAAKAAKPDKPAAGAASSKEK